MKANFKKHIFLVLVIFLFVFSMFVFLRKNNNLIPTIEKLAYCNWELDEEIVRKLSFKLAQEQPLIGTGEKYLLLDSEGNTWLFKLQDSPTIFSSSYCRIEESVSRWGRLCGLNVPYVHRITLPVNGKATQGTIQRMISDVKALRSFNISELTSSQIGELLKQQVLDYFVDNYGSTADNFLLCVKTGEIYGVDKDSSFDINEKLTRENDRLGRFVGEGIYSDIWGAYTAGKLDIDLGPALALIDLMSAVNDKVVFEIFNSILDEPGKVTFSSVEVLLDKRERMFEEFAEFYRMMLQKRGEILKKPNKNELNRYKKQVLRKLETEINYIKSRLNKINNKVAEKQEDIRIVSSEDAWLLIEDKIFNPYCNDATFGKQNYTNAIRSLENLRNVSKSTAEKLAITIYILVVNELFLREDYNFADPFVLAELRVAVHPDLINPDVLKDRYSALAGEEILQDMEAEFYYAMMLSYFLQGQLDKANYYVLEAQEKGFRIDGIWKKRL